MQSIYQSLWVLLGVFILCHGWCEKGVYEYGVNNREINFIVNEHNTLRLLIAGGKLAGQPRGVNLNRLYWDKTLAKAAQNIANTCIYGHVKVTDSRMQVGQNIATSFSTVFSLGANWTEPIMGWWNEYKNYRFGMGFTMSTGHYTQMAWDNTRYVGCGFSNFPSDGQFQYQKIYVCNYGPAGNLPRFPYKKGNQGCENLC